MVKCTDKLQKEVHMNERAVLEVRRALERALRRRLHETVWKHLLDKGWVDDYLKGTLEEDPKEALRALKEEAQDRTKFAEELISEVRGEYVDGHERPRVDPESSPAETPKAETIIASYFDYFFSVDAKNTAMLRATSAYFGWLANQHPNVVQFRTRVLEGRTLSLDEARRFMGSYAARFFPLEWFLDWRIPIVDHTSEIVGEYDWGSDRNDIDHRVTVRVDPPGIIERVRYAHPEAPILDEDEDQISTRCVVMKKSRGVISPYDARLPEDPEEMPPRQDPEEKSAFLAPPVLSGNYQTPTRPASVWPGSVVDDLYALAEELADAFRWPGRGAAAEFVLTSVAPLMRPVDASLKLKEHRYQDPRWQIELNVSPWVSAEEVARAYRRMQEQVLEGRYRLPEAQTFKVARFVWEQERRNGYKRPSWPTLCERWNSWNKERGKDHKERGKDLFEDYRNFRMYFKRAEEAVKELNFS